MCHYDNVYEKFMQPLHGYVANKFEGQFAENVSFIFKRQLVASRWSLLG